MTRNRLTDPATTPKAIEDCHALLAWMLPQLDKFPRSRRFTSGSRIDGGLNNSISMLNLRTGEPS